MLKPASEIKALTDPQFKNKLSCKLILLTEQVEELINDTIKRGSYTARVCLSSCTQSATLASEIKLSAYTLVMLDIDYYMQSKLIQSLQATLNNLGYYTRSENWLTEYAALGVTILTITWQAKDQ